MTVYLAKYTPVILLPERKKEIKGEPVVREVLIPTSGNEMISLTLAGETWVRVKDPAVVKWLKKKIKQKGPQARGIIDTEDTGNVYGKWKNIQWLLMDPPTRIGEAGVEVEIPERGKELWEPPTAEGLKWIIKMIEGAINKR